MVGPDRAQGQAQEGSRKRLVSKKLRKQKTLLQGGSVSPTGAENEPRLPYLFTGVWKKGFSLWIKEAF